MKCQPYASAWWYGISIPISANSISVSTSVCNILKKTAQGCVQQELKGQGRCLGFCIGGSTRGALEAAPS